MKLPEHRTGVSSIGLAGCVILAGVVFNSVHPAWLMASAVFILMGTGLESGRSKR